MCYLKPHTKAATNINKHGALSPVEVWFRNSFAIIWVQAPFSLGSGVLMSSRMWEVVFSEKSFRNFSVHL